MDLTSFLNDINKMVNDITRITTTMGNSNQSQAQIQNTVGDFFKKNDIGKMVKNYVSQYNTQNQIQQLPGTPNTYLINRNQKPQKTQPNKKSQLKQIQEELAREYGLDDESDESEKEPINEEPINEEPINEEPIDKEPISNSKPKRKYTRKVPAKNTDKAKNEVIDITKTKGKSKSKDKPISKSKSIGKAKNK